MKIKNISKTNTVSTNQIQPWIQVLGILAWGILLLKYVTTGQYKLLIHPNYFGLILMASLVLLTLAIMRGYSLLKQSPNERGNNEHITLFPPALSSSIILGVAILGLLVPPKILTSQTALQRGVTESLPLTFSRPEKFISETKPEERSIIDWIRTLNAYPEPDTYNGQPANLTGFVVHLPELPDNYILLSRFIVTCCAVDAYPVGIPIELSVSRDNYPPDMWLKVTGEMKTETLFSRENDRPSRQLVLATKSIQQIPTPSDPYGYR